MRDYRIGTDLGLVEQNAHFAVVADFDDVAGYVTYRDDPEHQRIIAELIRPASRRESLRSTSAERQRKAARRSTKPGASSRTLMCP